MNANKLVYSAHFYGYTGPNHSGATGIGETTDPRYRDLSISDLYESYYGSAAFVALDTDTHYVAPFWFSEFGVDSQSADSDKNWFINTLDYIKTNDLDFAYWPLIGYVRNGGSSWGTLIWDIVVNQSKGLHDGGDWREGSWNTMVADKGLTGEVETVRKWSMLDMDNGDYVQSTVQRARGDWDSGASKAMCVDGQRLVALSNSQRRGLCTDSTFGDLWSASRATTTVWTEDYVTEDWANGYTKYQCPEDNFVVGYAMRGSKVSTIMCALANRTLGTSSSTTIWFDQGDNMRDNGGGQFADGDWRGGCTRDEWMSGVAFSTSIFKQGKPDAILCRK